MKQILVIGEKTSQVKIFASTLCRQYKSDKQAKYIYTYKGNWQGLDLTFLPLAGHIGQLDTAKGFGWGEVPPIKLVYDPNAIIMKNKSTYVRILKKHIKGKDELWLATDPDAEGSNIAWEVMSILHHQIRKHKVNVKRIWNSSLTQTEIIRAFTHPQSWSDHLALGVQGRRLIDAWIGFAGTRELTRAARQVAKVKVISVGRVQLPTLLLIVRQDLRHEMFTSTDRWKLTLTFQKNSKATYVGTHSTGYFYNKDQLEAIVEEISPLPTGTVRSIKTVTKKYPPPIPLNTTAGVSLLTKILKISASRALELMVTLYDKALLSYPRTENKQFKPNFPHKTILSNLLQITEYQPFITKISDNSQVRVNGPKKGEEEDHDPIHPTGDITNLSTLNNLQKKAFNILTRYYISLFMDDFIVATQKVETLVGKQRFDSEGRQVQEMGWRAITNWQKVKTNEIPKLEKDEIVDKIDTKTTQSKTKPPARLTDSQLVLLMEQHNIGTKSSRPDIIKKLQQRNYIKRTGQKLVSTPWGRALIAPLITIWPDVVTPKFTAHVEKLMDQVAKNTKPYNAMVDQLRDEYLKLHQNLLTKLNEYKKLLQQLNLSDQQAKFTDTSSDTLNQLLEQKITVLDD